ncbi:MAG TPA: NAD(P)/FAD-dependent oxidoreductase [Acidimicrobiales bacterium]|jgi:thioredoxin reductase|nr:NAD(P)/FAD-dependent oxidoreductase [Acidimicrobiales bacterium]
MTVHDAVVVGGGPAGLAAGLWLARYRRRVVVVDSGEHRNRWVDEAHGYLGFDPINPAELLERAGADLAEYPEASLRTGRVTSALRTDGGLFALDLEDGDALTARRLVLATGVGDVFPEVDRFFEHYGADVFHCPTCDGYEAKGKDVVALGWSEEVTGFALTLRGWARSVTVVTDGRRFEGDDDCRARLDANGIAVLEDDAVAFIGSRGDLQGVRLRGGQVLPCAMAFFTIGHRFHAALADQLGCERTDEGCVVVDHEGCTTAPGVYAAGDLVPGLHLVQVAAAKGTVAGVACARSLRGEGGEAEEWQGEVVGYAGRMTQQRDEGAARQEIDQLDREIDEVRNRVAAEHGEDEPRFIDEGALSEDQPVDDTIAPPG